MQTVSHRSGIHSFRVSNAIQVIASRAVAIGIALLFGLGGITEAQQLKLLSSPKYVPPTGPSAKLLAAPAPLAAPLSETFKLHSRPAATKVIYLDFDGHTTTGTAWNKANNAWKSDTATITTAIWSIEGDTSFTDNEKTIIQEVWQRVSECFSPFNVNVTTEDPTVANLLNTGGTDTRWGIRACIGAPSPASPGGGWGFVPGFGTNSVSGNDTPCFVFNLFSAKVIADTCVHEVGHTLGLGHDGDTSFPDDDPQQRDEYYGGHGTGPTGWAPHMGSAYNKPLAQFSQGEYLNANNFQDDLSIIVAGNGFGYRPDDAANTRAAAGPITGTVAAATFNINQNGVIEKSGLTGDEDWYKISCGAGNLALYAVGGPANTMLDIQMELYNSAGTLIGLPSNPPDLLTASINRTVAAGTYFVRIDGVGRTGDGSGTPPDQGYSDYGSLGQYTIQGTAAAGSAVGGNVVASYNAGTKKLTLTGDVNANTVTVTFNQSLGRIEVAGSTGTKINNKTTVQTYLHTGSLNFGAVMGDGNDSVYLVGIDAKEVYLNLGSGTDNAGLSLCGFTADGKLFVDGGTGTGVNQKLVTMATTIPPVGPNRVIKNIIHIDVP